MSNRVHNSHRGPAADWLLAGHPGGGCGGHGSGDCPGGAGYIEERVRRSAAGHGPAVRGRTAGEDTTPHPNEAVNQPGFPPRVYFSDLNADSLNLLVVYWFHPPDQWSSVAFAHRVNMQIMERFNAEGIDFAFPSQTMYLAGDSKRPVNLGQQPRQQGDTTAVPSDHTTASVTAGQATPPAAGKSGAAVIEADVLQDEAGDATS